MTAPEDLPRPGARPLRAPAMLVAAVVLTAACSGSGDGGGDDGAAVDPDAGPNRGPVPTLVGGVDLPRVEVVDVLVGEGLAYGDPLPSEQAAAQAYTEDPEVAGVLRRRIHSIRDGRLVGHLLVLRLDGSEVFDEGVLAAFERGLVGALGGGDPAPEDLAGRTVVRARGEATTAIGYREGDLLVVVAGPVDHDVTVVAERQLTDLAAGVPGAFAPTTPLVGTPVGAAFVPVPTVTFGPIPSAEEEVPPAPPALAGATAVEGRYGVVAGERRTTVWSLAVADAYRSAEALQPATAGLVSSRAVGGATATGELGGRVVLRASADDGSVAVAAFRHHGLVLLVEGTDAEDVEAVVSAWIAALG